MHSSATCFQNGIDLTLQAGEITFNNVPYGFSIDCKIIVHEDVPHSGNAGPGDFRMLRLQLRRHMASCFPDDLKVVDDPRLDQLITLKGGSTLGGLLFNATDGFLDIPQPLKIVSHRDTASRSTRGRIRSRNPLTVTTSTSQWRSACRSTSNPPRSRRLRPGSSSTRKSTSLFSSASPRTMEPNTRTFLAPCVSASRKIS